ncbi:YbaY family lipoprotein [Shewanella sp. D64]|uniref:YbaY family lipoprotein n=1 Tax=unclassified Shewanella TaxID=196818 RepID=UPI0022BA375A|nr:MULTISPECIES: YbaY family lipoprotein [unclassified Shewanella]MEC4726927.1 YbaY family lipoprotein [Shewanella sp. D64]MEC4738576.1 YbaY family lipoprotein [Shewanella sp. E94]WBJ93794.1 YbaY family lipoprotein [Shewanella sp. MTB7]
MKKWLKSASPLVMTVGLISGSLLFGCATPNAGVEIHGDIWFKERMALPPEAMLTVQVKDVSLMDAPAVVIAEIERGDVTTPAPFQFIINRDQFEKGHTYSVGASISLNGKLMFINTQAYKIDLESSEPMSVLVQKVGR